MSHSIDLFIDGVHYENKTIDGVSIRWGRQSVQDQPEPTSCSFSLLRSSSLGTIDVTNIKVGAQVKITVAPPSEAHYRRFFGIITDVDVNYETINVAAVATGIYVMRQLSWTVPSETQAAYSGPVTAILTTVYTNAAAQLGVDLFGTPPTRYPLLSVDGDYPNGHPTAEVLYQVPPTDPPLEVRVLELMNDWRDWVPSGVIWEDMLEVGGVDNVNVVVAGQLARDKPLTPDLTLTTDEVLLDWDASRDLGLFCTSSAIGYQGAYVIPAMYEVEFPYSGIETYISDLTDTWGAFAKSYTTQLLYEADAAELAKVNVQNGQVPGYVTEVTVPFQTLGHARQAQILPLLLSGNLVEVPTLATGVPTLYFLEGYTETISQGDWTFRLMLSDPSNSWYGQRWQDVTPTLQWDQVGATTTWLDLQGMEL